MNTPPNNIFAGIDNLSLDRRKFDPSRDNIENICRFFSIGKLQQYRKEKDILISHSNFFVFVETTQGQYALKFYPPDATKRVLIEHGINRILINHDFPTPIMYANQSGQPFLATNNRLATCYSYIDGIPLWQHIKQRRIICQTNASMLSLKNILSNNIGRIPLQKQETFTTTINTLAHDSRIMSPYDQKKMIDTTLQETYRIYQHHQVFFTRQCLHNNATLTNYLIYNKTVYTLDLEHVREDYTLSDLASMVDSCLTFDIPTTTIKNIVKNYFTQHKIEKEHFQVLNTLVKIGLIREYLKNIRREKSEELSSYPPDILNTYKSYLSACKKHIPALLKRINDIRWLVV